MLRRGASQRAEDIEFTGRWKVTKVFHGRFSPEDEETELQMVNLVGPNFESDVFELCQAQSTLPSVEVVMDGPYDIPVLVPKGIPLDTTDSIGEDYGIITFVVHLGSHEKDQDSLLLGLHRRALGMTLYMQINKMKAPEELPAQPFSLKAALEEGFFSDLAIRSAEGQQCCAHRAVLSYCCPGMKYQDWEAFLSSLPTHLLKAALHYVYTDRLPPDLKVPQVQELLATAGGDPRLSRLTQLCKATSK